MIDRNGEEQHIDINGMKTPYEFGLKILLKYLELGHLDAYISGRGKV